MGETAAAVRSAHVAVGLVGNPTPETVGGEGPHLTNGVNAVLSALQSADTHWVPVTARLSSGISPPLASVPWGLRNKAVRSDTVWQVVACAVEETGRGCGSAEWDSAWAVRAAETGPRGSLDELWVIGLAASGAARRPARQEVRSEGSRDSRAWRVSPRPAGSLCAVAGRAARQSVFCLCRVVLSNSRCYTEDTQIRSGLGLML